MLGFLSRLLGGPRRDPLPFGFRLDYDRREYIHELGALGTHAWVVTGFEDEMPNAVPGVPVTRLVNMGDLPNEPLRRTRTVRGPLVLQSDHGIPLFQGEKTPAPASGQSIASATDYIDAWADSVGGTGYPS